MKKISILVTAIMISAITAIPAFAGQWRQDNNGWWYENDDGSYPLNQWMEIEGKQYYFGADGYMLADTTTPDGYQVGADGAWIQGVVLDSRPTVSYYDRLFDPNFYGALKDGQWSIPFGGKQSDLIDHGDYYELKNQTLSNYKVYDTEKEAKKSRNYSKIYGIEKRPDGKYLVCDANDRYEAVQVYSGSLYIDKNALVQYHFLDAQRNLVEAVCTIGEYFALPKSITYVSEYGYFNGDIIFMDEKGYVTFIRMWNAG